MKKITRSYDFKEKIKYPELVSGHIDEKSLVLTIETTGLSSDRHRIISVTTAVVTEGQIEATVFFSENKNDELEVIEAAVKEIKASEKIITWNGDSFDLKFLAKRSETYAKRLEYNSSAVKAGGREIPFYDLSKLLRPLKRLLPDDSLSIYMLLSELGLRDTTLPDGRTVTTLYKTWENTDEKKYAEPIIDHSIYKVTGIINLLSLLDSLQINKVKPEIEAIRADTDCITASGSTDLFVPIPLAFTLPGIHLTFENSSFTCVFDTIGSRIRIYYPDYSSYVRLKENGQLIPKELSRALPSDTYEKVTRDNCYSLSAMPEDTSKARKQLEGYIRQLVLM